MNENKTEIEKRAEQIGKDHMDAEYLSKLTRIPTLHLPIKGKWFDMILSGVKKEEYRDNSDFYSARLIDFAKAKNGYIDPNEARYKPFKVIHLTNGYGHHCRQLWAKIDDITIGKGKPEWGAPDCAVFIIHLGEIFHTKNLK